jgi:hypothetical protein
MEHNFHDLVQKRSHTDTLLIKLILIIFHTANPFVLFHSNLCLYLTTGLIVSGIQKEHEIDFSSLHVPQAQLSSLHLIYKPCNIYDHITSVKGL